MVRDIRNVRLSSTLDLYICECRVMIDLCSSFERLKNLQASHFAQVFISTHTLRERVCVSFANEDTVPLLDVIHQNATSLNKNLYLTEYTYGTS